MSFRKTIAIGALALSVALPAGAYAASEGGACILSSHQVTGVTPYRVAVQHGHFTTSELRGATVHVQAERGLTAEWLRLEIGRHLAAMQKESMPDCALDLSGVAIRVGSAGAGFDVTIFARDAK